MGLMAVFSGCVALGSWLLGGPGWLTVAACVTFVLSSLYVLVRVLGARSVVEGLADSFLDLPTNIGGDGWGGGDGGGGGGD
jgi:hypothetical protein